VQGGSIRVLCKEGCDRHRVRIGAVRLSPPSGFHLNDGVYLKNWRMKSKPGWSSSGSCCHDRARQGRSMRASAPRPKATLLMQMADIGHDDIAYVAEDNALKAGRFLPAPGCRSG